MIKVIKRVEMANDNDIYEIVLGSPLEIIKDDDGFSIIEDDEAIDWRKTHKGAELAAKEWAMRDDLIVTGYGKHSGQKLWKLPDKLLAEIKKRIE